MCSMVHVSTFSGRTGMTPLLAENGGGVGFIMELLLLLVGVDVAGFLLNIFENIDMLM